MKTSICYAHAIFRGNPSVFGQTPPKLHMTKILQFLEILDHVQNKNTTIEFAIKNWIG